ncbi:MAG TPA: FAD-binding protein [Candidatus Dormibacteraeota bacterium]|jgi:electron transfer flavoprotein alpha subunit
MIAAVCVKQVPMLIDLRFDTQAGRMVRDGVRLQANPLDNIATLTTVAALAGVDNAEVVALCMGPPQSEAVLRHAIGLGADRGILVCDPLLAGSDTLATARVLVAAIRRLGATLVVLGRHSIDAETGQTGAMVAGLLDWPVLSAIRALELTPGGVRAQRETDDGVQTVEASLPVVLTVADSAGRERWPSAEDRERAAAAPLQTWDAGALRLEPAVVGSAGSPTSVGAVRLVTSDRRPVMLDGGPATAIEALCAALRRAPSVGAADPRPGGARPPGSGVWAVVEAGPAGLRRVSRELVGAAAELADALGGPAVAVALGAEAADRVAEAGAWGADAALAVPSAGTARGDPALHAAALGALIRDRSPAAVLLPSTTWGREVAGIACAQLGLGLTGDAIGFEVGPGGLLALKPALGGALVAPIASSTVPAVATVRSGALAVAALSGSACPVEVVRPSLAAPRVVETSFVADAGEADLTWATTVFCAGMGLGEDGIALLQRCARQAGASVAATRRVCEAGWLPRRLQVGLTGHSIAPQLYVAAGVRGAFEHLTGIRRAAVVVAINTDPQAPIFEACDYGMVGDAHTLLPLLAERLAAARSAPQPLAVGSTSATTTEEYS